MSLQFSCFVTGTDTGVGKTLVTAALLHALNRAGLPATGVKPVAAGTVLIDGVMVNDDVAFLAAESGTSLPRELTTPYLLHEAAAPHIAAALEHVEIDAAHLLRCYQQVTQLTDAVVVEGVGGFRVPLNAQVDTADLAAQLDLDLILVVGLRLGCINHALLTAEAIAARGLRLVGWVANQIDVTMPHQEANLLALQARLPAPLLGVLPWMAVPSAAAAADCLDFSRLPTWPVA
jgi:dethiobiotin synthetase